jgi:hypothetical protein
VFSHVRIAWVLRRDGGGGRRDDHCPRASSNEWSPTIMQVISADESTDLRVQPKLTPNLV